MISDEAPCEDYPEPGQSCLTAGLEAIESDGLCGPCATHLLAHSTPMEIEPGIYTKFGRDLLGPWESQEPAVQQAWRNLEVHITLTEEGARHD